jgi:hypothetical protein
MSRRKKPNVEIIVSNPVETKKKNCFINNKELCEKMTEGSCLRPDIFLKNRDCDDCYLNKYCIAPNKIFSWDKRKRKKNNEN